MKWDGTVNLSAVIAAASALLFGLGFIYAIKGDSTLTQERLNEFRTTVTANAITTQNRFDEGVRRLEGSLSSLQQQISNLPDLTARVSLIERQLASGEARDAAQDQRIDSLRQRVVEIGADVEGLKRASAVSLPGRRTQ